MQDLTLFTCCVLVAFGGSSLLSCFGLSSPNAAADRTYEHDGRDQGPYHHTIINTHGQSPPL
jgi:hypothetical protein